jgi:hypothetical protein
MTKFFYLHVEGPFSMDNVQKSMNCFKIQIPNYFKKNKSLEKIYDK